MSHKNTTTIEGNEIIINLILYSYFVTCNNLHKYLTKQFLLQIVNNWNQLRSYLKNTKEGISGDWNAFFRKWLKIEVDTILFNYALHKSRTGIVSWTFFFLFRGRYGLNSRFLFRKFRPWITQYPLNLFKKPDHVSSDL